MPYQHTTDTFLSAQDDTAIFWQRWMPEETRRVLVVQHGLGEHSGRYQNLLDALEGTNTAVYAPELRGHGRSDGKRGYVDRFERFAEDLDALVQIARKENSDRKVFLLGHSLGGAIALWYALQQPYQQNLCGLILSSPTIEVADEATSTLKKWAAPLLARLMPSQTLDSGLNIRYLSHDPQVVKEYEEDPLVHAKISLALGYTLLNLHRYFYAHAGQLSIPVYIYHGTGDRITSAEASKKLYQQLKVPDKTLKLYDDLYHETMNERDPDRQRVLSDLKAWVLDHSAESPNEDKM